MTAGVCKAKIVGDSVCDILCESVEVIGGDKGFRNGVECSTGLEANCIVLGSSIAKDDGELNGVNEEVDTKNGSTGDHPATLKANVVSQESFNGEIGQANGSESVVVETIESDSSPLLPLEDSISISQGTIPDLLSTGNVINTVEDLGLTHDPVENRVTEVLVVDSPIEEVEPQLLDIAGEDSRSEEQMEDEPTADVEFVDSDVKLCDLNKEEGVEATYDKESQVVVMKNVHDTSSPEDDTAQTANEAEQPLLETEEPLLETEEPLLETEEPLEETEEPLEETEAIKVPITNEIPVSQLVIEVPDVHDDKQTVVEVKEAPVVPVLIFPDTFVSPEIDIQFGSFGCQMKDPNNTEIVLEDLQGNRSAEKVVNDMDDMVIPMLSVEVSNDLIDAQIEDNDNKIDKVEDVIQHETLCLQDEVQLVSNMESQVEIRQPLNQKNEIEEHLKDLRKELGSLEDDFSKHEPEVATLEIRKTYEEKEKEKEIQTPYQVVEETKSIAFVSAVGQKTISSSEKKYTEYQTVGKGAVKFNQKIKTNEHVKFVVKDSMFACLNEILDDEEDEFDKKLDENLKEQNRLEEKIKANEQKEKARVKRSRKKEKKTTGGDNRMDDQKIVKPKLRNAKIIIALALIIILTFFLKFVKVE